MAVKKKNKMKKIKDKTKTERSADYVKQTLIKDKTKTERSADYVRQTLKMAGNSNHKY